jgi:hypothetical protein
MLSIEAPPVCDRCVTTAELFRASMAGRPVLRSNLARPYARWHFESLAAELHRDREEVQALYERVYLDLSDQARIRDYLPLFVARRARRVLVGG